MVKVLVQMGDREEEVEETEVATFVIPSIPWNANGWIVDIRFLSSASELRALNDWNDFSGISLISLEAKLSASKLSAAANPLNVFIFISLI